MKLEPHGGAQRVPAIEVRLVLDNARQLTNAEWAASLGVHAQTVKAWRADGFVLGLWSAPSNERWEGLRAEAAAELTKQLLYLQVQPVGATGR